MKAILILTAASTLASPLPVDAGTYSAKVVFTRPGGETHEFIYGPTPDDGAGKPGWIKTAFNPNNSPVPMLDVASMSSLRPWGWDGAVSNPNGKRSLKMSSFWTFNNVIRAGTLWNQPACDPINQSPQPPLLTLNVPAGAKYIRFEGTLAPAVPLGISLASARTAWVGEYNSSQTGYSYQGWAGMIGEVQDSDTEQSPYVFSFAPSIEVLKSDGTTRIGTTPYLRVAGLMAVDTYSQQVAMPASWPGGNVKIRFYGWITAGYTSETYSSLTYYLSHYPTTGSLRVTTDQDATTLSGTIIPPPKLTEGYKGNIPIRFSVANQ